MKLSRALLLSILITLALTLILQFLFGAMAFGLFLFLPLGYLFTRNRPRPLGKQSSSDRGTGPDSTPIEPR